MPSTLKAVIAQGDDAEAGRPIPLPGVLHVPLLRPVWHWHDWLWLAKAVAMDRDPGANLVNLARTLLGVQIVIPVDRASSAIRMGLAGLGVEAGDEVLVPSMMCRGPVEAVLSEGCVPVLVDVDEGFHLDVEKAVDAVTPRTRAVLASNSFGKMFDVERLRSFCAAYGLHLIDDAALSLGASSGGQMSGSVGIFGVVSFNQGKNVIASGGGLFVTSDVELGQCVGEMCLPGSDRGIAALQRFLIREQLRAPAALGAKVIRGLRGQDIRPIKQIVDATAPPVITPRAISPIQALIASRQLQSLEQITSRSYDNARLLSDTLAGCRQLRLPHGVYPEHVFSYYTIVVGKGERWPLARFLGRRGIEAKWSYFPLHFQERYSDLPHGDLQLTENLWDRILYLPCDASLEESQVLKVGEAVKAFYADRTA